MTTINCSRSVPPDVTVNDSVLSIVFTYLALFILAFVGNVTMFLILCRNQLVKVRRVHSLLLHMNIAHLLVTLVVMPKEILHNYMVAWFAGDVMCRICKFFDVFAISLSMNVLICITLDRFYSIFFPLYAMRARKSVQRMVSFAWTISFVTSAPQLYLFKTATHPCFDWYTQCVSKNFIGELSNDVVFFFSIVNIIQVYIAPLFVTVVCYSLILWRISRKSKLVGEKESEKSSELLLRRNGQNNLEKAKSRTLKMTFVIVLAFIFCWTPYSILMFLHFLRHTDWIPKDIRKFIYAFAVLNSAISPYLYGYFSFDIRKELQLLFACSKATAADRHLSCSANVSRNVHSSSEIKSLRECANGVHRPVILTAAKQITHYRHDLPVDTV
ncbi:G-protein coupled receptors family 1 profile domain-containing protein [Caenorhabditis elegans]|uniref:G-protein coupled receptors family 1 profile domain-containing protein n=1 Tax=Caenorhabditis elegans TaxID=6239 RepID=H1ZUW9_CAEEL|nr:G-protein coupled receptors family 1 profile domain-containing protein [Caenorhabditis elegans]CCF23345.1 G-protein coupled receptors family 1 profile domain-containing protein [Caenorhabditis elegans]|eukprot:NP_001249721.1 human GoNadotropin-Releasing hormone Receptor (GnRHR) related [Caenorhabditis elegans]